MILGGLGYFAAIILQLAGTARLSGSLSSLMNSLNPVAISVMAAIFLKERITWKNAIGIVISFAGVYVIFGTGELQADLMGILFSAGSYSKRCVLPQFQLPQQTGRPAMLFL